MRSRNYFQSRSFIYNFGVCVTAPEPEKFNFGGFNKNHEKCQFYILFLTTTDILKWFNKVLYTGNFHIIVYSCQLELLRKTKYLNYSFIKCFFILLFKSNNIRSQHKDRKKWRRNLLNYGIAALLDTLTWGLQQMYWIPVQFKYLLSFFCLWITMDNGISFNNSF